METMTNVPAEEVGEIVQSFVTDDQATQVTCKLDHGSNPPTWTIIAVTP